MGRLQMGGHRDGCYGKWEWRQRAWGFCLLRTEGSAGAACWQHVSVTRYRLVVLTKGLGLSCLMQSSTVLHRGYVGSSWGANRLPCTVSASQHALPFPFCTFRRITPVGGCTWQPLVTTGHTIRTNLVSN